jgi:hypothetical protein
VKIKQVVEDGDKSTMIAVCKHCGQTLAMSWNMKSINPYDAAVEAARALEFHKLSCDGRQ